LTLLSKIKNDEIKVRGNIYAYDLNEPLIYIYKNIQIHHIEIMSHIGGAFITALSAEIFFLVTRKLTNNKWKQILLVIIYAFATNSLSTSSQGLWQHGTSQLLLSAALFNYFK